MRVQCVTSEYCLIVFQDPPEDDEAVADDTSGGEVGVADPRTDGAGDRVEPQSFWRCPSRQQGRGRDL